VWRFIFTIVLTVIAVVPAFADVRIMSSAGGPVVGYLEFFSKVRKSGERMWLCGVASTQRPRKAALPRDLAAPFVRSIRQNR
jgi:hypothetical protein